MFRNHHESRVLLGARVALFTLFLLQQTRLQAGTGTEAASFLNIPVGGGPAAMGAAYTALAQDAYAPTWNPAGLGFLENTQLSGQHLSYLESIHYEHLSAVRPLRKGRALGIAAQYLGTGEITGRTIDGDLNGDFSSRYAAYTLAYGQTIGPHLSLGVAAKFINAKISDVSANAYAADFGAMYKMGEKITLAGGIANVGTELKFLRDGGTLPLAYKAAVAVEPASQWTLSAEGVHRNSGLTSAHAGIAWRPIAMISLRAGYRTDTLKDLDAMAGLTTGIGLDVWGHELAYAWVPYGDLGNTQYFSILVRFGQAERERRNLIHYQRMKTHRAQNSAPEARDPDYQQLMQLLSDLDREIITRNPLGQGYSQ